MLAVMTGNVGIAGGRSGAREGSYSMPFAAFPILSNPIKTFIPMFLWTDAIYRHHEMTDKTDNIRGAEKLSQPIKFIWNYAGNCIINQHSDTNRTHQILQDDTQCEMTVVIDNHMTASARYADIIRPDLTAAEQPDFSPQGSCGNMGYAFCDTAVSPMYECRSIYDICRVLLNVLWTLRDDEAIRPLPEYVPSWEGHESPETAKYPLQLFGYHYKSVSNPARYGSWILVPLKNCVRSTVLKRISRHCRLLR